MEIITENNMMSKLTIAKDRTTLKISSADMCHKDRLIEFATKIENKVGTPEFTLRGNFILIIDAWNISFKNTDKQFIEGVTND